MGRSLAPLGGDPKGPPIDAAAGLPFEAKGVQFRVEARDGRVFHKMRRRDAEGKVFAENEAEVRYALGSGTRGIAFLIERDGFLFQSPIAWFAQRGDGTSRRVTGSSTRSRISSGRSSPSACPVTPTSSAPWPGP